MNLEWWFNNPWTSLDLLPASNWWGQISMTHSYLIFADSQTGSKHGLVCQWRRSTAYFNLASVFNPNAVIFYSNFFSAIIVSSLLFDLW